MGSDADVKRKQDRWWLADVLMVAGEILLYFPRVVFRIIKEIF